MLSTDHFEKPTVALAMKHLPEAHKVSRIFRKTGVIAVLYESLESFWNGVLIDLPTLCVVDIRLIVEGERALCNHPKVKTGELTLVFFHTQECAPLMSSAHGIFNLGTLNFFDDGHSLEGQLKSILRRVNRLGILQMERDEEVLKVASLEQRLEHLVEAAQDSKSEEFCRERLQKVWEVLMGEREQGDFWSALGKSLEVLEEVTAFSVVELSPNGQKLMPPLSGVLGKYRRYKELPPLWLGKICNSGIEFFARNMVAQVSLDLLGGEQLSLLVEGRSLHPEKIVFVKVDNEEFVQRFDWKRLERYLSDSWCYFFLKSLNGFFDGDASPSLCHPWEFFSLLDRVGFDEVSEQGASPDWVLIDGDFSNLIKVIRQKSPVRFYWEEFFNTFCTRFLTDRVGRVHCHMACMGVGHVGFLIPVDRGEEIFNEFKAYSQRYPYWRYFEDAEIILAKEIRPTVRMVPLSAEGYLGILEGHRSMTRRSPEAVQGF